MRLGLTECLKKSWCYIMMSNLFNTLLFDSFVMQMEMHFDSLVRTDQNILNVAFSVKM